MRGTESVVEEDLGLHLAEDFLGRVALEGSLARDHFEQEDAQRPDVDLVVVGFVLDHLGRHVLISAAEGLALA